MRLRRGRRSRPDRSGRAVKDRVPDPDARCSPAGLAFRAGSQPPNRVQRSADASRSGGGRQDRRLQLHRLLVAVAGAADESGIAKRRGLPEEERDDRKRAQPLQRFRRIAAYDTRAFSPVLPHIRSVALPPSRTARNATRRCRTRYEVVVALVSPIEIVANASASHPDIYNRLHFSRSGAGCPRRTCRHPATLGRNTRRAAS